MGVWTGRFESLQLGFIQYIKHVGCDSEMVITAYSVAVQQLYSAANHAATSKRHRAG
jgi:hypothetical protein